MVARYASILGLGFALLLGPVAIGGNRPTGDLHDPLAEKERADVTWGGVQCAVNATVIVLTGGVAAALAPDINALIFSIVREEIEANPADFTLPAPVGRLEDAFNRLITKVSQNPGIVANTAMVTLLANAPAPPGMPAGAGMMQLFKQVAVIRALAECGINIYRGVVQLSKDVPGLITDLKGWRASSLAVQKMCRDHKGFVSCNHTCYGTPQAMARWMPRCEPNSSEWQRNVGEVIHGASTYCFQTFCKSQKSETRIKKFEQCRLQAQDDEALAMLTNNKCRQSILAP